MSAERLLVTGASGYLGTVIARRAAEAGTEMLGLDVRSPGPDWPDPIEHRRGDVTDPAVVEQIVAWEPDVVVHLAWVFDPTHDDERERRVDLEGTANVFRGAVEAGARRIVYPSSTTSYGIEPGRARPFVEEDGPTPNPRYPYAFYKAKVEEWLDRFRSGVPGIEVVVFRACIVLGANADNIVSRLTGWPLMPRVAGANPPLQFLHEEDAAELVWWGITEAPAGTYNAAGAGLVSYSEIIRAAGRVGIPLPAWLLEPVTAVGWTVRLLPFPPGLLDYIRYPWVADTGKLRAAGFEPRHTTREALAAFVESR